ncbi:hypothetical protein [Ramlibacter humi]|uniref:Uncharacterized protein n=1 Tax=Ramlibacter humi TaxID=2530451 RepID=A0A4Z0BF05_9BURK|nr:hypothetical protein [Ramlibacter humi]TFY97043.1 hypothetical protein EZ216_19455 [Ramlibacter humi]
MPSRDEVEIAAKLQVWQRTLQDITVRTHQMLDAAFAYMDGDGPAPEADLSELEERCARADALAKDLLLLVGPPGDRSAG